MEQRPGSRHSERGLGAPHPGSFSQALPRPLTQNLHFNKTSGTHVQVREVLCWVSLAGQIALDTIHIPTAPNVAYPRCKVPARTTPRPAGLRAPGCLTSSSDPTRPTLDPGLPSFSANCSCLSPSFQTMTTPSFRCLGLEGDLDSLSQPPSDPQANPVGCPPTSPVFVGFPLLHHDLPRHPQHLLER